MPFLIKTTFSFAGLEQGWSESFYWNSADGNLATAEDLVTPIMQKRAKLLANGYVLTVGRNSIVRNEAGDRVRRETDLFEPRAPGVAAWKPAQPNVAMLCVFQTANNRSSKKYYPRGLPAGLGDTGKKPNFDFGSFTTNFNAWREAMIAFPMGWLKGSVQSFTTITAYTLNATTGQITFTLAPGFAPWPVDFGVATPVYVTIPGKSSLDGRIMVVPTSATSCYTPNPHPAGALPVGQIGTMVIKVPNLVTLAPIVSGGPSGSIHPQRLVTHKTGRPSYASRGRSAVKPRW